MVLQQPFNHLPSDPWKDLKDEQQVPHSQCSRRENPKFLQNFRPKNNK
jgi:hypothetical protein